MQGPSSSSATTTYVTLKNTKTFTEHQFHRDTILGMEDLTEKKVVGYV